MSQSISAVLSCISVNLLTLQILASTCVMYAWAITWDAADALATSSRQTMLQRPSARLNMPLHVILTCLYADGCKPHTALWTQQLASSEAHTRPGLQKQNLQDLKLDEWRQQQACARQILEQGQSKIYDPVYMLSPAVYIHNKHGMHYRCCNVHTHPLACMTGAATFTHTRRGTYARRCSAMHT